MRTIAPIVESFNVKNYCQSILFGNFIFRMPYKKKLFFVIGATAARAFVRLVNSASNWEAKRSTRRRRHGARPHRHSRQGKAAARTFPDGGLRAFRISGCVWSYQLMTLY